MDATVNATVNSNFVHCIKSASQWGNTVYTNICTGKVDNVVWGFNDYAFGVFLCGMGLLLLAAVVGMILLLVREVF